MCWGPVDSPVSLESFSESDDLSSQKSPDLGNYDSRLPTVRGTHPRWSRALDFLFPAEVVEESISCRMSPISSWCGFINLRRIIFLVIVNRRNHAHWAR